MSQEQIETHAANRKYQTTLDGVLDRAITCYNAECGDAITTVWYGLIIAEGPEGLLGIVGDTPDLNTAERNTLTQAHAAIITEDPLGFVEITYFSDSATARAAFDEITQGD